MTETIVKRKSTYNLLIHVGKRCNRGAGIDLLRYKSMSSIRNDSGRCVDL